MLHLVMENIDEAWKAFATAVEALGVTFLGPTPTQMTSMGLKHEARAVAIKAGVPVVPGSEGAVNTLENAVKIAGDIGYPILVKASGGGGGMGMQICRGKPYGLRKLECHYVTSTKVAVFSLQMNRT